MSVNSVRTQIFMLCVSLIVLTAVSIQLSSWWLTRQFNERQINSSLLQVENTLKAYLSVGEKNALDDAKFLVSDRHFKRALISQDKNVIQHLLKRHAGRIKADVMMVMDGQQLVTAVYGVEGESYGRLIQSGLSIKSFHGGAVMATINDRLYRLMRVPINLIQIPISPHSSTGSLLMGFEMDHSIIRDIKKSFALDLTFHSINDQFVLSTLPGMSFDNASLFRENMTSSGNYLLGFRDFHTSKIEIRALDGSDLILMAHTDLKPLNKDFERLTLSVFMVALAIVVIASFASSKLSERLTNPLSKMHKDLVFKANYDGLTGLLNRAAALEAITHEFRRSQRDKRSYSVILIDLDLFKNINDTYGHAVGDEVLKAFSSRVKATLRPFDVLGRFGGEEFIVGIPQDRNAIPKTLDRILRLIADTPFTTEAGDVSVTISAGAYVILPEENIVTLSSVIEKADTALYDAKRLGRNQAVLTDMIKELSQTIMQKQTTNS